MRRTTRKAVIHLFLFGTILLFILFLNRPQHSNRTFAWNKIRYKTTSSTLPETRGICPGLAENSKPVLVVARVTSDDSKWLDDLASRYLLCVYTADASLNTHSTHLQVPANRGHEAMAYLTFLIDNYSSIPSAGAVFIHGSRFAWHNDAPDYDNAALLSALDIHSALKEWGYHNLRCDWSLSTCPTESAPQGSLDTSMQAILEPWDKKAVSDAALPGALKALFGGDGPALGRGDAVRSQCCAQFVASREQIWKHSREEYVALRQWLLDGSTGNSVKSKSAAPSDDRVSGRILSYVWHVLFMKQDNPSSDGLDLQQLNAQACPNASECYCRLYGRCDLERCSSGRCAGQYQLPKDLKLPADWAAKNP